MKILIDLYFVFLKIGGFTLGGGLAMIPIIQHEMVDVKKWVTESEMTDFITVSQSTPGVVGINVSTAVGQRVAGFKGALAATLGMITPSVVIIILVSMMFDAFLAQPQIQYAFQGVRAAVVALVLLAVYRFAKSSLKSWPQVIIAGLSFAAIVFFDIYPPYMVLASAAAGVAVHLLRKDVRK